MTQTPSRLESLGLADLPCRNLLGYPVLAATMDDVVALCERAIKLRVPLFLGQASGPTLVKVQRDYQFRRAFLQADLFFADGAGVVLASRVLGRPVPERIAGIDLMYRLMQRADAKRYRVYLLGAEQWVLDKVVESFRACYPGAVLVGSQNGFFTPDEEPGIAQSIAASNADILLVAMTSPKKEHFIVRWREVLGVPVLHGVGGSFDVVAGKVRRAPALVQRLGLEWSYRIAQEPRRMWRRTGMANVLFAGMVAWEWIADILRPEG
jgi:N-acetylglucosaminyldiphosphoundecaprenol N-acetyl-beta-D-mannosaminyltransferase